ncbi:MAG: glycosyltransferase [Polyangiaceae bacterium]|nr:glycosyltransferase [Polyangiaceae bacterium]
MASTYIIITSSFPASEADYSGHFIQSEVQQITQCGGVAHVICPARGSSAANKQNWNEHPIQPAVAFGPPGALRRLRQSPWLIFSVLLYCFRARQVVRRLLAPNSAEEVIIRAHWLVPHLWPIVPAQVGNAQVVGIVHGSDLRLLGRLPQPCRSVLWRLFKKRKPKLEFVSRELRDEAAQAAPERLKSWILGAKIQPALLDIPSALLQLDTSAKRELRRRLLSDLQLESQSHPEATAKDTEALKLFVVIGRLIKSKRIDTILRAHLLMPDTQLVCIGEGPLLDNFQLNYPRAVFLGALPRYRTLEWILVADALLSASRTEGASTVIREAEQLGTPVVAAASGDLIADTQARRIIRNQ